MSVFSLPTQRCFQHGAGGEAMTYLFSAYAEVFLAADKDALAAVTFLCLRRGVSKERLGRCEKLLFSLPTQRCFLFP